MSHVVPTPFSVRARAEEAVSVALADPERARLLVAEARAMAEAAGTAAEPEDRVLMERALGLAARELSDLETAKAHFSLAVDLAVEAGLPARSAEARMSLLFVLAYEGDFNGALYEAELAAPLLEGGERARLECQRATILQRLGRLGEALGVYGEALPVHAPER